MNKLLSALGMVVGFFVALACVISLGNAFHAAFIQGGLLWNATPFQLVLEGLPYLVGALLIIGAYMYLYVLFIRSLKAKSK